MAAGRGSIATSSRVSCIRLTTDATPTTKPIPSFGSRRPLPRVRAEILRRRPRRDARAVVGRPSALPDAPSTVVHSLAADRCAALSKASCCGAADRRRPGRARREPGPVRPLVTRSSLRALTKSAGKLFNKTRAQGAARTRSYIPRYCERSEAIHPYPRRGVDCFAALAMTWRERGPASFETALCASSG